MGGKKMVKKVKAAGSYIRGGKGQKRRAIAKLARRFLGQQGSPESVGGGVRGAMPLEYLEEDYEAGVDALPQQLRFCICKIIILKCMLAGLCFRTCWSLATLNSQSSW